MEPISLEFLLQEKAPQLFQKYPKLLRLFLLKILEKTLSLSEMNAFLQQHSHQKGTAFIEAIFQQYQVTCAWKEDSVLRIPQQGRLVIVANLPVGSFDVLALLKWIREVRPDIRVVVNEVLSVIEPLREFFIPINVFGKPSAESLKQIAQALSNESAVLFFPAGEVSRWSLKSGIEDGPWNYSPIAYARKFNASILPIYQQGRNSWLFYFISLCHKNLSMFLLPRALMNRRPKRIHFTAGHLIPAKAFQTRFLKKEEEACLLKKHVYGLAEKDATSIYKTIENVLPPVSKALIEAELLQFERLNENEEPFALYLLEYASAPYTLKEIGRLREVTFRKVQEGTGFHSDLDEFDAYYKHLVLWDSKEREIMGAYRLGFTADIVPKTGLSCLYTTTLFEYTDAFTPYLTKSIECGRTFIQEKYWRSRALNYLWKGVTLVLNQHQEIQYLFGGVSISRAYPIEARELLVFFYRTWFKSSTVLAKSRFPYEISPKRMETLLAMFPSKNYEENFAFLKQHLKNLGMSVPVLYKYYSDLCSPGGLFFLDFVVDKNFDDCVDGLMLLDVNCAKENWKRHYQLLR